MAKTLSRPVLFLDIDGVLNSNTFFRNREKVTDLVEYNSKTHAQRTFDPAAIDELERIVESVERLAIVLTSTYRHVYNPAQMTSWMRYTGFSGVIEYQTCFDRAFKYEKYMHATRPPGLCSWPRGFEIKQWIDDFSGDWKISRFSILDDDDDMGTAVMRRRLVQTDKEVGLTAHDANRVISMLKGNRRV